jgi:esterase/lipase superfamily enzyme
MLVFLAGGCRQMMMPTPVIYHDDRLDPFFDTPEDERSTTVEVFYATDRQPLGSNDEPRYTNGISTPVGIGLAKVRLGGEKLTWQELKEASSGPKRRHSVPLYLIDVERYGNVETTDGERIDSDELDTAGRELSEGEQVFIDELNRELAGSVNKDLSIYVHGFNVTFDNPCLVAGELHHFLAANSVIMAYAWPCRQSPFLFQADVRRARESAPRLARVLEFLAAHSTADNINVLCYSAGAPLVAQALHILRQRYAELGPEELRQQLRIGRVIFAAAAINLSEFRENYFESIYDLSQRLVILLSRQDTALALADPFSWGRSKLGATNVDSLDREDLERMAELDTLDVIDVSHGAVARHNDMLGHAYWYANPWVATDILASLRFEWPPERRALVHRDDKAVWYFPEDYPEQIAEIAIEVLGKSSGN